MFDRARTLRISRKDRGASWGRLGDVLEHLGGVLERPDSIVGCLGAVLGHLGPFWKRAGGVLGASGVRLRVSWEPPWPVLWASCERLGASWRHIVLDVHAKRSLNLGMPS